MNKNLKIYSFFLGIFIKLAMLYSEEEKEMKKYPFEKQIGLKDCGVASLKMIIKYYGGDYPIENLRILTNTSKSGTSAYDLIEGAKKIGLDSAGYEVKLEDIDPKILPVIAYTVIDKIYQHYVVIYEINYKKQELIIGNPATKLKKMKMEDFKKIYQNIIISFSPLKKLPIIKENQIIKHQIKLILLNNKKTIFLILFLSIIITLLTTLITLSIKILLDNINLIIYPIIILVAVIKYILELKNNESILKLQYKINQSLYQKIFEKIIFLPYQYYRNRTTGEILSKITNIEKVSNFIINTFSNLIINLLIIIFSFILMYIINIKMLFVILILTFFICLTPLIYKEKRTSYLTETIGSKSIVDSYLYEAISGFETVKGLNIEEEIINKTIKKNDNFLKVKNKYSLINIKEYGLQNLIYIIGNIVFILIGTKFIKDGIMRISDFVLFFSLYNNFSEPFMNIIDYLHDFKDVKISIKCIEDLFIPNTIKEKAIDTYYKNTIILGPSGVGKSTLLKKIKGYYSSNNKDIIYISQNEILFTDTIFNNILIANKNKEDLDKVIDICELRSVIESRKLKGNSLIEENGYNLSGGEKQRIILARSIIKNPKMLLIDEGLSEVNIDLERKILKNIMDNYKDMIIIFVSHRKENIDLFDNVINLERSLI